MTKVCLVKPSGAVGPVLTRTVLSPALLRRRLTRLLAARVSLDEDITIRMLLLSSAPEANLESIACTPQLCKENLLSFFSINSRVLKYKIDNAMF